MRIAQIAPLYEAVPPKLYGGTERIVSFLTDALVDLGHDVTLFSSADAVTRAELVATRDQALRLDPKGKLVSDLASHMTQMRELRRRLDRFDVLHFHTDMIHFPFFSDVADRTLTTLHGRLDMKDLPELYRAYPEFPLVSISNDQRRPLAGANWLATVHHGGPGQAYAPPARPRGDYLAFLGRISPEKRPDRAIRIAIRAGLKIRIAAKVDDADRAYFHREIEPLCDHPLVEFIGEIGDDRKGEFLGNARAVLFPIDWPEPFGLVMIEAMGCGTPVIAWRCGSVPEVIDDGVTGFIVESENEAVDAVARSASLDRRMVRARFDLRFSARAMARNYVALYEGLVTRGRPGAFALASA